MPALRFPHARREGPEIKRTGRAAFNPAGDISLEGCKRRLPLRVVADQVPDIVARVAETSVPGSALDPVLHRIREGDVHRGHGVVPLQTSQDEPS